MKLVEFHTLIARIRNQQEVGNLPHKVHFVSEEWKSNENTNLTEHTFQLTAGETISAPSRSIP